ncbi:MAG: hypothetical protein JSV88_31975 [Candidatus Aminicenantes bacterium]|nr:MAG: hypothetical protein JSV88_31975 [Candidatus Aminicenantes bacterium]
MSELLRQDFHDVDADAGFDGDVGHVGHVGDVPVFGLWGLWGQEIGNDENCCFLK